MICNEHQEYACTQLNKYRLNEMTAKNRKKLYEKMVGKCI